MNSEKFSSLIFESKCANIPNSKNNVSICPGCVLINYTYLI